MTNTVTPQTTAQLLQSYTRELILLCGKDGVGKSCAIVSTALYFSMTQPEATFHVIDSEHKLPAALKSFGDEAPRNLSYWPVDTISQAITALDSVIRTHKPGDWLAVESAPRLWDMAQSETYVELTGLSKKEFLALAMNQPSPTGVIRKGGPIPNPDLFWQRCKAGHDGEFVYRIINCDDLNLIMSTTVKKQSDNERYASKDRAILRAELGIDANLDGPPRLPYLVHTMCLLELLQGKVTARILRDNNSSNENTRPTFDVPDRRSWAMSFWSICR